MPTILFPRKGNRLRAHSVFFQAARVAASGFGVISDMVPSRSSATAIAVASGSYRKGPASGSYAGGSLTSIPAASEGMHRYDLVVFDCSDSTLKRIEGAEETPTNPADFLENLKPVPPELENAQQILLGIFIVTFEGVQNQDHGQYCTAGVANMIIEVPSTIEGPASATDGNLLEADGNSGKKAKDGGLSHPDVADAVGKRHTRNDDDYLDYGGVNQCAAADVKDAVTKKHSNSLDHSHANKATLDSYTQTEANLADAVTKKHSNSLDHSHANKATLDSYTQAEANLADAVTKKHSNSLDHSHANKATLDTYNQSNADIADAVTKKHSNASDHAHANKALLDSYDQANAALADAVGKRHSSNLDTSILDSVAGVQVSANELRKRSIEVQIGNGITPIAAGWAARIKVPFGWVSSDWEIVADQTGSISLSIVYATFAEFPSYNNWFSPGISGAQKASGSIAGSLGPGY